MARNRYDQASRYAAKMDPPGFLCWQLRVPTLPLRAGCHAHGLALSITNIVQARSDDSRPVSDTMMGGPSG